MTNTEVRAWYLRTLSKIAALNLKWTEEGCPLEERARRASQIRHDARLHAREMMGDPGEVEQLRARDQQVYGRPDGPTFDQLLKAHRQDGCSDDEAFERIIIEAQATNAEINEHMRPKDRDSGDKPK